MDMKILVLCTGNTCRSPMAEGILKAMAAERGLRDFDVESMGFAAFGEEKPTTNAVTAMKEIGIDISAKRSRRVTLSDLEEADIIYVMTPSHKDILLDAMPELDAQIKVLEIADPYGRELDVYRECRDRMTEYFTQEFSDAGL